MSVLSVSLLACAATSNAALIASDNFESYTVGGQISGGSGGTTWAGNWSSSTEKAAQSTIQQDVIPGGFGKSLQILGGGSSTGSSNYASRTFADQTGTFYVGFTLYTSSTWGDANDLVQFWMAAAAQTSQNSALSSGIINAGLDYFARTGASGNTTTGGTHTNDNAHLVVMKLSKSGGSGDNYDTVALYVDQLAEGTPTVQRTQAATFTAAGTTIGKFAIRLDSVESTDLVAIDNLQIATTYAEVIPEPNTLLLNSLGVTGFSVTLVRNRRAKARSLRQGL